MRTAIAVLTSALALSACTVSLGGGSRTPSEATTTASRVPGTAGDATPGLQRYYTQRLAWTSCTGHAGFQCTKVTVPLDYSQPSGRTIQLAVNRLPSTGHPVGSLLTNPGGPGGSGLDYLYSTGEKGITATTKAAYDLIGFDPRGVGESAPVECLSDADQDSFNATVDLTPDSGAEQSTLRTAAERYAAACEANSGGVLPYVGTVNAARDMDVLRTVLGDDKLNYLGISYGTELGQVYASLFPHSVGRMVLDSVVDTQLTGKQSNVTQMIGVQRAFDAFIDDCVKRTDCALGTSRAAALQKISDLLTRLDTSPLPVRDGRRLNDNDARIGLITVTYSTDFWQYGRAALAQALAGDGTILMALADSYRERDQSGHYSNVMPANLAIGCLETPAADRTEASTLDILAAATKISPLFGNVDSGLPCAYLKVPVAPLPPIADAKAAPPILLLNNLGDNATPIEWARAAHSRLPGSVLVTNDQSGHGVYGRGSCVNSAVDGFLVNGKLPAPGTACADHGSLS